MGFSYLQSTIGRVLPVKFNGKTGTWNGLIVFDADKNVWTDFVGNDTGKGNLVALKALQKQTKGKYTFDPNNPPKMIQSGKQGKQWFHILEAPYFISQNELNDAVKTKKFRWTPLQDIIDGTAIDKNLRQFLIDNKKEIEENLKTYGNKEKKKEEKPQEFSSGSTKWPQPGSKNSIHFYHSNQPYYEFANTYPKDIYVDHHDWKSSEHYYQAGKFNDSWSAYEYGVNGQTPLKDIGYGQLQKELRNYKGQKNKEIWQEENLRRMLKALWAKFTQHDDLNQMLLETQGKIIVEDAGKNDAFFGAGADYNGENHLGQMLMQVRDLILALQNKNIEPTIAMPTWFAYEPHTLKEYADTYNNNQLMVKLPTLKKKDKKEEAKIVDDIARAFYSIL